MHLVVADLSTKGSQYRAAKFRSIVQKNNSQEDSHTDMTYYI